MKDRVLYRERSSWPWWVHLLVSLTLIAAIIPLVEAVKGNIGTGPDQMPLVVALLSASLGLAIPVGIYALMGDLRTLVTAEGLDIRWGLLEIIRKWIPFHEVESSEAVTYSPLREFGGWGIRYGGKGKKTWNIRGNRAVLLHLRDGTRFYLGSEKPERILQWITSANKRSSE